MTAAVLSPSPKQHFDDNTGVPASGYQLFTYTAGTTTKLSTYTDNSGTTANSDPIILDSRGEADIWLPYGSSYKFVLAPPTDSDPPTNPVWTVDNIAAEGNLAYQSASNVAITGGTISTAALSDTVNTNFTVSTAELDVTNSTTLTAVSGLAIVLTAGGTYSIGGRLSISCAAGGGLKMALQTSDNLTAASINIGAVAWNGTTLVANNTVTALGSNSVASTAVITDVYFEGAIVVSAGGTLIVQAAQNASNATSTKVLLNSTLSAVRVS